jgi:putative sigma-54 modulation protein
MEIKIQGAGNFTVSDKIKEYLEKRLEKLDYFKGHIDKISFHLENEKQSCKVNVTLSLKKLGFHKFEADAEDMYSAIDKAVHKMDVKIEREKTKIQDHSSLGHGELNEKLEKDNSSLK